MTYLPVFGHPPVWVDDISQNLESPTKWRTWETSLYFWRGCSLWLKFWYSNSMHVLKNNHLIWKLHIYCCHFHYTGYCCATHKPVIGGTVTSFNPLGTFSVIAQCFWSPPGSSPFTTKILIWILLDSMWPSRCELVRLQNMVVFDMNLGLTMTKNGLRQSFYVFIHIYKQETNV